MNEFITALPDWAGTVPQWALFFAVIVAVVKIIPVLRQQSMDQRTRVEAAKTEEIREYKVEVAGLRKDLRECEEQCTQDIKGLHEEIWGMRKQNIAEQISLINIILQTVDAPELRTLLQVLENIKARLAVSSLTQGAVEDERNA